jgi:2-polyprenyl-3-methyl-5-hydroxy-6-metoxy-1,4-benzoquinol methylase
MAEGEAEEMSHLVNINFNGRNCLMEVEEKGPEWYDVLADQEKMYSLAPKESSYYPVWEKVIEAIRRSDRRLGGRIIELGCGSGQLARMIYSSGMQYHIGIDFSHNMIELAKKMNPDLSDRFHCQNFFKEMPFLDEGDCIIMTEVLEHLEDDLKLIEKIPSGCHIIFSVPSYITQSHVRAFRNDNDIRVRYENLIRFNKIIPIVMNVEQDWKIFVCEGVKR